MQNYMIETVCEDGTRVNTAFVFWFTCPQCGHESEYTRVNGKGKYDIEAKNGSSFEVECECGYKTVAKTSLKEIDYEPKEYTPT